MLAQGSRIDSTLFSNRSFEIQTDVFINETSIHNSKELAPVNYWRVRQRVESLRGHVELFTRARSKHCLYSWTQSCIQRMAIMS